MNRQHPYTRRVELETAFKENQHDIFVQNCREFIELWVAEQKNKGKSPQQIEAAFEQITGNNLADAMEQAGRAFGSNMISVAADSKMLVALAAEMKRSGSILGRYYIDTRGGKQYVIFKGRPGLRKTLTGTRYLATNTKVMKIGVGGQALRASARGGFIVSVIFSVSLNSIDWVLKDEFRWTNWIANVSTDLVKVVISGAAGYAAGMYFAGAAATIAILPLGAAIVAGIVVAGALYVLDNHFGITKAIIDHLERTERNVKNEIQDGFYYIIQSTGHAVRRQLESHVRNHISGLLRRLNGFPVLR
ncbi:hypothetical protein [Alkalimonas amylolytica]|uniref:Uncharacterized protein n=1 Tax=Alkalimonas amylolytica TaxID=152573 RepID=A0A1H3ZQ55_ALKAM|nr:hypothetical protein [Alkalimonas amylolytica]SEA25402.1 hypothetical protein SAMN04488051_102282 [Alkalimonas amylolytica]